MNFHSYLRNEQRPTSTSATDTKLPVITPMVAAALNPVKGTLYLETVCFNQMLNLSMVLLIFCLPGLQVLVTWCVNGFPKALVT